MKWKLLDTDDYDYAILERLEVEGGYLYRTSARSHYKDSWGNIEHRLLSQQVTFAAAEKVEPRKVLMLGSTPCDSVNMLLEEVLDRILKELQRQNVMVTKNDLHRWIS